MVKTFYVCSYGGCGSTMLAKSLKIYGNVEHIHSRNPPNKLQYVGLNNGGNSYSEWFNGIEIPENELNDYYVIYIYKNPINSILSRFKNPSHLEHIQIDKNIKLNDVINEKKDLYGISDFYENYTTKKNRNYKIYCVKYEELFDKQNQLSELLGIGKLNLVKNETNRKIEISKYYNKLYKIYKKLIKKIKKNDFIFIS